jgi:hypothetical protein
MRPQTSNTVTNKNYTYANKNYKQHANCVKWNIIDNWYCKATEPKSICTYIDKECTHALWNIFVQERMVVF